MRSRKVVINKGKRRALLAGLAALCVGAPCCGSGAGGRPSQVESLRVIAVTADNPYVKPGDKSVTFSLTYADALDSVKDGPREVQVTWLGGCVNPIGDTYLGCFAQFPKIFQALAGGGAGDLSGLFWQETLKPELSGAPSSASFAMALPDDILAGSLPTATNTTFSTAYVFFAVCAGEVRPATSNTGDFPLVCYDKVTGDQLSPDSYVVGYTQVFAFSDGRTNTNPPVMGLKFDGEDTGESEESAKVVAACKAATDSAAQQGCGAPSTEECDQYPVEALVDDVAEVDPESSAEAMAPAKEAVWVDYFADAGSFDGAKKLIYDPTRGYITDHSTKWTPPAEAGLVTLWAVVHDARGGANVLRRFVRVE